jgi:FkbH-like protein
MDAFTRLKKNLTRDFSGLQPVRVALLGDTPTQWLAQAIRGLGYERGMDLRILEADFNQIAQQVYDPGSPMYASDPQVIILYHSTPQLLDVYNKMEPVARKGLANERLLVTDSLRTAIRSRSAATIIYYNYPEIDDGIYGNYANKTDSSFLYQVRRLNVGLMQYAAEHEGFHIGDLALLQQQAGRSVSFRPSMYVHSGMDISLDTLPAAAETTVSLIGALVGRIKKCLVLDLDNTIWGGTIGDDGLEHIEIGLLGIGKAFTELQYWIRKLRQRGILLAVCSKNAEEVARLPFDSHPDMVLSMEDFVAFRANWENKVDNIREIAADLQIALDSIVFLDDNPFERDMVREALPEVLVPELPDDPAAFLEYLYPLHLFETASSSAEDEERTKMYRTDQVRSAERLSYTDEEAYLAGLNMASKVMPFNVFNGPRVAQLSQRSNQFNLRTVRYTDAEVQALAGSPDVFSFSFTLEDRFGDNGIIGVVILRKETAETLFIDSWLMSCRVLRRGMENFTLNTIAAFAREKGFRYLRGEYLATPRNQMVRDHYRSLGFSPHGDSPQGDSPLGDTLQGDTPQGDSSRGDCWMLDLYTYENRPTSVHRIE